MTDFFQNGEITNLHRLQPGDTERLERELTLYSRYRPVALVLPALYSDLKTKPFAHILSEISQVQ
ncbi:MAG TPA: glycosyl transferase, partial [Thermodesulfobacteriota bacterium]|nr:glycosyl transferase [Thermodesulfobacteriota bacterium]